MEVEPTSFPSSRLSFLSLTFVFSNLSLCLFTCACAQLTIVLCMQVGVGHGEIFWFQIFEPAGHF